MDQPIRQVLQKLDLAGRMVTWSVELSEFDIWYEPRAAIKAQAMADFLIEMVDEAESVNPTWALYVDGASRTKGCGAGIIWKKEVKSWLKCLLNLISRFPIIKLSMKL